MKSLAHIWLIGTILKHRELLFRFTAREIERQTKGSWLGMVWLFVNPLLMLALFSVVFGMIMGGDFGVGESEGPYDFPLGVFIGLTVMGIITEAMGQSPYLILGSRNLVKKVVFPLEIIPVALIGSIMVRTLASGFLALVFLVWVGPPLTISSLWVPIIVFPLFLTALGLSWLLAALGVYFRDSQQMMGFLSTALFYASAIFYPSSRIPEPIFVYLQYNPVLIAVELCRDVLLWQIPVNLADLGYLYIFGICSLLFGYIVFQKLRSGFADVI